MTAVIAVKFDDRVELLTDRAITEKWVFCEEACKVVQLGSWPLVIVGRGYTDFLERVIGPTVELFDNVGSVAEAIAAIRSAFAQRQPMTQRAAIAEFTIAGMSESGPGIWWFQTGAAVEYRPIWELVEIEHGLSIAESIPGWAIEDYRRTGTLRDKAVFLMNGRREAGATDILDPALTGTQGIGAGIDHTIINAAGVTTSTIYRWPCDRSGQLLTDKPPYGPEHRLGARAMMKAPAPGLSRAQRRAAAAQARKAA